MRCVARAAESAHEKFNDSADPLCDLQHECRDGSGGIVHAASRSVQAAMQQSSMGPIDEPTAPETTGAKLGHQPTPSSVEAAESSAKSRLASLLAEAKALDAQGKTAACMQSLSEAKEILEPP